MPGASSWQVFPNPCRLCARQNPGYRFPASKSDTELPLALVIHAKQKAELSTWETRHPASRLSPRLQNKNADQTPTLWNVQSALTLALVPALALRLWL